jgi:probable HAF family extracellular repeat protein
MKVRARSVLLAAALGCSIAASAAGAGCIAPVFRVVALPLRPTAINARGWVAGTNSRGRASVWDEHGGVRELPLPAGFDISEGVGIDAAGRVLAIASDRTSSKHQAFVVYRNRLELLPGSQTRGYRINATGTISGEAQMPGQPNTEPVLWVHGALRPLGHCCGGAARDVNRDGAAIGDAYDAAGVFHAFLWTAAAGLKIIGPPGRYSTAIAINDLGHVLIQAFPDVYLYEGGALQRLTLAPRYPSNPRAINNCGAVVGAFGPYSDADRAFAWDPAEGFVDLNKRIPADSGWKLENAAGINDAGAIVGKGDYGGEDDSGFLLLPSPH